MTAQPTPEQRWKWYEAICDAYEWGTQRIDDTEAVIDAIFAAGHAAALEGADVEWGIARDGDAWVTNGGTRRDNLAKDEWPGETRVSRLVLAWLPVQP